MTQNIYDDPGFHAGYSRLPRSVEGLAGAPEWPALRALLPELRGRRVVDLGCGYGWFCRWAADQGAAEVLGLDVSEKMLERARAETGAAGERVAVRYARADLETLDLPAAAFDLAYSSLAFHYIADLGRLFATVHRALVPGARFVFSIEHPIFMAPTNPAWQQGAEGRTVWPLDSYLAEGPRTTDWFAPGVVKHHRTIGTTLNLLIGLGFAIRHVEEWRPTDEQIAARPEWAKELDRPMFLLIAAAR
ncbi:MAG TPA: class I SAM-dependent methyltransferase [Stellaceae bacterium]|nr:class I SAM-dependent methyltransferase [Stellaceae bacterium]